MKNVCAIIFIMKTMITGTYNKERLLRKLAENNHGFVTNVSVLSLQAALKEESDSLPLLLLELYKALTEKKDSFPIYGEMFQYPAFIKEIVSFAQECILYGITKDDLPDDNTIETDLKNIFSEVLDHDFIEKENILHKDYQLNKLQKDDVELTPCFFKDPWHKRIYDQLAQTFPVKSHAYQPKLILRTALNLRQEIEACAQEIVKQEKPCIVILTDPKNQLPVAEQVFNRYEIPYSFTCGSEEPKTAELFSALVRFALLKDTDSFLQCLRIDAFPVSCPTAIFRFLEETLADFGEHHVSDAVQKSLYAKDAERIARLEELRDAFFRDIDDDFRLLQSSASPSDALIHSYEVLRKNACMKMKKELQAGFLIRNVLNEGMAFVKTADDALFLAKTFSYAAESTHSDFTDFCVITDLNKPVSPAAITYVIGCTGSLYPGYQAKTGLIDEAYVRKIEKYPTSDERYSIYMEQLKWIQTSASDEIIYSCSTNDYTGREVQPAFEVETLVGNNKEKWQVMAISHSDRVSHSLKPEIAEQLFLGKETKITGSVSTIERWFNCPYSYFIQSGLKVREPDSLKLASASIGTIQHSIMENGVRKYGKNFAQMSEDEIDEIIDPCFEALDASHPGEKVLNHLTKERMKEGIRQAAIFLDDYEANNSYEPKDTEHQFLFDITEHVRLRGTIDRADTYHGFFRIIDYKSSEKSLSEKKVKAGLQLQLLSYLITANHLYEGKPAGAYYFSLKPVTAKSIAANVRTKAVDPIALNEETEYENMIHERRLSGWTFVDDTVSLDEDGRHIKALKTQYDFDLVKQCIEMLYEYFYNQLLAGNISLAPKTGACTFCDYRMICRFHGIEEKPSEIVMRGQKLTGKPAKGKKGKS